MKLGPTTGNILAPGTSPCTMPHRCLLMPSTKQLKQICKQKCALGLLTLHPIPCHVFMTGSDCPGSALQGRQSCARRMTSGCTQPQCGAAPRIRAHLQPLLPAQGKAMGWVCPTVGGNLGRKARSSPCMHHLTFRARSTPRRRPCHSAPSSERMACSDAANQDQDTG